MYFSCQCTFFFGFKFQQWVKTSFCSSLGRYSQRRVSLGSFHVADVWALTNSVKWYQPIWVKIVSSPSQCLGEQEDTVKLFKWYLFDLSTSVSIFTLLVFISIPWSSSYFWVASYYMLVFHCLNLPPASSQSQFSDYVGVYSGCLIHHCCIG